MSFPVAILTVSDVERLAKAGIKIKFADIKDQIMPDQPAPPMFPDAVPRTLTDSFWDRWKRAHIHSEYHNMLPYNLHASEYGGKVYVFVAPHDAEPFVLEDDALLYPSDALMAKLALWGRTK